MVKENQKQKEPARDISNKKEKELVKNIGNKVRKEKRELSP